MKKNFGKAGMAMFAMAGINIIWGSAFPIIKQALKTIPPFTFTFLRFATALIVLLILSWREALALLRSPDRRRIAVTGILGFCITQLSQVFALFLSPASDISLLATTTPLWVSLLAWLFLGERLRVFSFLGFALAISGILLILWPRDTAVFSSSRRIIGDSIFLVSTLAWAGYNVLGRSLMSRHDPLPVTTAACLVGIIGLVPFAVVEWLTGQIPQFTLIGMAAVFYNGLFVTVIGFLVLFWALGRAGAAQVAVMMYFQPLAGVIIAWSMLEEPLGKMFLSGAALMILGVWLVTTFGIRQKHKNSNSQ